MVLPKISIITASYNYAEYISQTIESIINQTYTNWELIIVDDGSKDNSVEIIKSYCQKDSRIKLYQHKNAVNKGLKDTLLLGIKKASSEWITFLESDDEFVSTNLEEKVKIINSNPNIKFIFNDIEIFGDLEFLKHAYMTRVYDTLKAEGVLDIRNSLKYRNPIPTFSCVMLKKEILKSLDFNSPIKPLLDYYLWLQVAKRFEIYFINKKLTRWRKHPDSYINQKKIKFTPAWNIKTTFVCPFILKQKIKETFLVFNGTLR